MPFQPQTPSPAGRVRPGADAHFWQRLRDKAVAGMGSAALREFFLELNRALVLGDRERDGGADVGPAVQLLVEVVEANPDGSAVVLGSLLTSTALQFHDPLAEAIFQAARRCSPLLGVLADLVEIEHELIQCRVRAVDALVMRSPDVPAVGPATQPALRFLTSVQDELGAGPEGATDAAYARWAQGFRAMAGDLDLEHDPPLIELMADALDRLGTSPVASDTMGLMLKILRANPPLPVWHPATAPAPPQQWARTRASALTVDKAIQVVLAGAAARWRARTAESGPRLRRPEIQPSLFNEQGLEATLLDVRQPPRTRAMAAGLLRVLTHATPS